MSKIFDFSSVQQYNPIGILELQTQSYLDYSKVALGLVWQKRVYKACAIYLQQTPAIINIYPSKFLPRGENTTKVFIAAHAQQESVVRN